MMLGYLWQKGRYLQGDLQRWVRELLEFHARISGDHHQLPYKPLSTVTPTKMISLRTEATSQ